MQAAAGSPPAHQTAVLIVALQPPASLNPDGVVCLADDIGAPVALTAGRLVPYEVCFAGLRARLLEKPAKGRDIAASARVMPGLATEDGTNITQVVGISA